MSLAEVVGDTRTGYFEAKVPSAAGKTWPLRALVNQSASPDSKPIEITSGTGP